MASPKGLERLRASLLQGLRELTKPSSLARMLREARPAVAKALEGVERTRGVLRSQFYRWSPYQLVKVDPGDRLPPLSPLDKVVRAARLPVARELPPLNNPILEAIFFHKPMNPPFSPASDHHWRYVYSRERLEFHGDRELAVVASRLLLGALPVKSSGDSSLGEIQGMFVNLNSNAFAAHLAAQYGLDRLFRLKYSPRDSVDERKRIADLWEAYLGALWLANGEDAVLEFLAPILFREIVALYPHVLGHPPLDIARVTSQPNPLTLSAGSPWYQPFPHSRQQSPCVPSPPSLHDPLATQPAKTTPDSPPAPSSSKVASQVPPKLSAPAPPSRVATPPPSIKHALAVCPPTKPASAKASSAPSPKVSPSLTKPTTTLSPSRTAAASPPATKLQSPPPAVLVAPPLVEVSPLQPANTVPPQSKYVVFEPELDPPEDPPITAASENLSAAIKLPVVLSSSDPAPSLPVDSEPAPPEPGDVSVASSLALATTSSENRGVPLVFASEADALTERKFVKALEEANLIDYYGAPQLLRLNVPNGDGEWIPAVHAWCPPVSKVQTTRQRAAFKTMIRKAMVAGIVRVDPLAPVGAIKASDPKVPRSPILLPARALDNERALRKALTARSHPDGKPSILAGTMFTLNVPGFSLVSVGFPIPNASKMHTERLGSFRQLVDRAVRGGWILEPPRITTSVQSSSPIITPSIATLHPPADTESSPPLTLQPSAPVPPEPNPAVVVPAIDPPEDPRLTAASKPHPSVNKSSVMLLSSEPAPSVDPLTTPEPGVVTPIQAPSRKLKSTTRGGQPTALLTFASERDSLDEAKFVAALEAASLIRHFVSPQLLRLCQPPTASSHKLHAWAPAEDARTAAYQAEAFTGLVKNAMKSGMISIDSAGAPAVAGTPARPAKPTHPLVLAENDIRDEETTRNAIGRLSPADDGYKIVAGTRYTLAFPGFPVLTSSTLPKEPDKFLQRAKAFALLRQRALESGWISIKDSDDTKITVDGPATNTAPSPTVVA